MKYTKVIIVTLFCVGFVLGSASVAVGQGSPPAGNGLNPKKIALLKWYPAIQTGAVFFVGYEPYGVAFDGANMWVVSDAGVTKLRAADGANLGTFDPGFKGEANEVAFDGNYIWVTTFLGDVFKLLASDPNSQSDPPKSFSVGGGGCGVAFDGINIWVAKCGGVTKLRAADGANLGTFDVAGANHMAFDGANIWVTGGGSVTELRGSDGTQLGKFNTGAGTYGVAFDGANIWVGASGGVTKLRASDGLILGKFKLAASGALAFDGANIWVGSGGRDVTELRASDGTILGTFQAGISSNTSELAFDGANIWVTYCGGGDDSVCKL